MDATTSKTNGADAHDEIRQLRAQVESLLRDRVTPALSQAAGRAEDVARQVGDLAQNQSEALTRKVRERPFTSILIAAAAGYLIGRVTR